MELKEEITQLESQLESMKVSEKTETNPIEKNPTNIRDKGTTVKMDNVPKDKEDSDKLEDEDNKFVKLKKELSESIEEFNNLPTMEESKIFIDDFLDGPPGANIQMGPKGGFFYDTDTKKKTDKPDKKVVRDTSSDKDLSKAK